MKRLGCGLWVVLLVALASACSGDEESFVNGPVITRSEDPPAYPLALVRGSLSLRDGCLMVGDNVVFWPVGTTWEPETESVTFGEVFEGAPSVSVGSRVEFGGGVIGGRADLQEVLDGDRARDALLACLEATGAESASFVYPKFPAS